MFTRMSEVQVLNAVSFNKMFASELEWEIVKPPVIFSEEDIDEAKERFGVSEDEVWSMWSIFGYDMIISCHKKNGCVQFKLVDPDFGSMLCIPSRIASGLGRNIQFELSATADDVSGSVIYHLQVSTNSGVELLSKYVVLNNIE